MCMSCGSLPTKCKNFMISSHLFSAMVWTETNISESTLLLKYDLMVVFSMILINIKVKNNIHFVSCDIFPIVNS